ncbi:hypothetical protein PR048_000905 [Dryococelus australis]|uniref:Uncharacterized protein n=1 Tax=Dryococelus australis TaxID=614101 RepID=A0ABQ9IH59_9NEOP|nr:hypothetical protein PR048_000905 [Dryococelus australis]
MEQCRNARAGKRKIPEKARRRAVSTGTIFPHAKIPECNPTGNKTRTGRRVQMRRDTTFPDQVRKYHKPKEAPTKSGIEPMPLLPAVSALARDETPCSNFKLSPRRFMKIVWAAKQFSVVTRRQILRSRRYRSTPYSLYGDNLPHRLQSVAFPGSRCAGLARSGAAAALRRRTRQRTEAQPRGGVEALMGRVCSVSLKLRVVHSLEKWGSSAYWSLGCVFTGCCPTHGIYGNRWGFLCKSAIGSEAFRASLISCDPIAKRELQPHTRAHTHTHTMGPRWLLRLACSPSSKAIRVLSPAGSLRVFACGNRAGRCHLWAGFLGDLPFPLLFIPALLHTSIILIRSQDGDVKRRPNLFAHSHSNHTHSHPAKLRHWAANCWSTVRQYAPGNLFVNRAALLVGRRHVVMVTVRGEGVAAGEVSQATAQHAARTWRTAVSQLVVRPVGQSNGPRRTKAGGIANRDPFRIMCNSQTQGPFPERHTTNHRLDIRHINEPPRHFVSVYLSTLYPRLRFPFACRERQVCPLGRLTGSSGQQPHTIVARATKTEIRGGSFGCRGTHSLISCANVWEPPLETGAGYCVIRNTPIGWAAGWRMSYEALISERRSKMSLASVILLRSTLLHLHKQHYTDTNTTPTQTSNTPRTPHKTSTTSVGPSVSGEDGWARSSEPMRVIEVSMEQSWDERAGETGYPLENPPHSGIVRHDSHMRKSGSDLAGH